MDAIAVIRRMQAGQYEVSGIKTSRGVTKYTSWVYADELDEEIKKILRMGYEDITVQIRKFPYDSQAKKPPEESL